MKSSSDLLSLLQDLSATRKPTEKLRLLARSWTLLRELTPVQRERLFAAQGLKQAGDLIRRIDPDDESVRSLLLALAGRVGRVDPDHLGDLLSSFKKGGLAEVLEKGMEVNEEPIPTRTPREPPPPADMQGQPTAPDPTSTLSDFRTLPGAEEVSDPPLQEKARDPVSLPDTQTLSEKDARAGSSGQTRPGVPSNRVTAKPPGQVGRETTPPPFSELEARHGDDGRGAPPEEASAAEEGRLGEVVGNDLTMKFRVLREALRGRAAVEDPGSLLRSFPTGWARRRVLMQLIRSRAIRFEEACDLVEGLAESSWRWCIPLIVETYQLNREQRDRLRQLVDESDPPPFPAEQIRDG